jgi:two-component system, sensor histidine kinase and response regulator
MSALPVLLESLSQPPAHGDGSQSAPRTRVLLAEDDRSVRKLVQRVLERADFEVLAACDGAEAIELALRETPDLALVDLGLPRVSGIEVIAQLKAAYGAAVPCLVLSGQDAPDERMAAFDAGADDFVGKPVQMKELVKRVSAFERTRRAYVEAKRANETADRLRLFAAETAALLAHDLNNGLSVASANLAYVAENVNATGEVLDAIEGSERALRRMIGLVRNFVDIARFEDAALEPSPARLDVGELLATAALIHDPRGAGAGAETVIECPPGLIVSVDPVLLERVIHNLLNNATRYVSRNGTIRLQGQRYQEIDGAPWLRISVANSGGGIPAELSSSIFEKYRVGSDGRAQRGMGLYFCRLACEALGGSINLEEDPEFPTQFVIRIPLASPF